MNILSRLSFNPATFIFSRIIKISGIVSKIINDKHKLKYIERFANVGKMKKKTPHFVDFKI